MQHMKEKELDGCMIVCLYLTEKNNTLAMPAWNETLINAIYTAQGNVGRMYANLLKYGLSANCRCLQTVAKKKDISRG